MLDIVFPSCSTRPRNGQTRRDFLRAGTLGLVGLSLPALRRVEARESQANAKKLNANAQSVILVFLGGGLSHLDTFDPKPGAPADIRGKYTPIRTSVPGLTICEKLPMMAKVMDRVALVRSGVHTSHHHETATNWVLSGRLSSPFGDYPAIGATVAHETGFSGAVPPYVAVPRNPSFTWELGKSAFLGERYESFKAGDASLVNYREICIRNALLTNEARLAFDIDREAARLRDRYGRTTAGQSMLLARRLVENGVRFVTVNYSGWDQHANVFDSLDRKLPEFDRALSALIEDMDARGTFGETLLVVMSEFGRTPKLNHDAGRDHWGQASSLLFAGAGVKRGVVLGQTDKHGAFATERPVSPADVACTILDTLGIDSRRELKAPDGRPNVILDAGVCVKKLFA
jgi:uncharacterized protein (DUF1501 family)